MYLLFSKNGNQNPQWNVIGSTIKTLRKFCHIWICWEWMIDVANFGNIIRLSDMECCAFIRHLVIEFANNGKTLKLPKMEYFSIQKSPHLATFGLPWSCQFLALKHTSKYTNYLLFHNWGISSWFCFLCLYGPWTTLLVAHSRDWPEFLETPNRMHTSHTLKSSLMPHAFIMWWKSSVASFCVVYN